MYDLIVVIVPKHRDEEVMEAAQKAGAKGGTILHGRSIQTSECHQFLGLMIQPEKEIVLILVDSNNTDKILDEIESDLELNKPNNGIALVLDASEVIGLRG